MLAVLFMNSSLKNNFTEEQLPRGVAVPGADFGLPPADVIRLSTSLVVGVLKGFAKNNKPYAPAPRQPMLAANLVPQRDIMCVKCNKDGIIDDSATSYRL